MKRLREIKTASNKTRLLKVSQKTSFTFREAKFFLFSEIFSNCMNDLKSSIKRIMKREVEEARKQI